MPSLRKLENVYLVLDDKEHITPAVQENMAALLGEAIEELKKGDAAKVLHPSEVAR